MEGRFGGVFLCRLPLVGVAASLVSSAAPGGGGGAEAEEAAGVETTVACPRMLTPVSNARRDIEDVWRRASIAVVGVGCRDERDIFSGTRP